MEPTARQRVVVVDDEPDILASLHMLLDQLLDADVIAFASPIEALKTIASGQVDILLADHRMPEMDGMQLIRRSREFVPDLGTMMITAYPDVDLAIRAINEGRIVHFFQKPTDADELVTVIDACLRDLRRLQDRRAAFERALERGKKALSGTLGDDARFP